MAIRTKITSEFLLVLMVIYAILIILIKTHCNTYTLILNTITLAFWTKYLDKKNNHLRKKSIIFAFIIIILNFTFINIGSNESIINIRNSYKKEFILNVTFDYFSESNYELGFLTGVINQ